MMMALKTKSTTDAKKFSFEWNIENFTLRCTSSDTATPRPAVVSDPLTQHNTTWQLKLVKDRGSYNLKMILLTGPPRWVMYEVTLPQIRQGANVALGGIYGGYSGQPQPPSSTVFSSTVFKKESTTAELIQPNKEFGFAQLIVEHQVNSTVQAQNDTLTIACEITAMTNSTSEENPKVTAVPECDLGLQLESVLQTGKHSDLTLVVGTRQFKAHKVILSARSKVFATMLESGMKEAEEGKIIIEDIEPGVVEEMLTYMYTGEAPKIKEDYMADKLLQVADKYDLDRLKALCEGVLCDVLTIENAAELFELATLYRAEQLKEACLNKMRSFSTNWQQFMKTAGWGERDSNTDLAAELTATVAKVTPNSQKDSSGGESDL